MKWMKWFLILALGACVALGTAGCGSDDDEGAGDELVGTWNATSYNGQAITSPVSVVVTLRSDGTATAITNTGFGTETMQGTWSAENGALTVTTGGETTTGSYSISGNTLTLVSEEGTSTFTRQ